MAGAAAAAVVALPTMAGQRQPSNGLRPLPGEALRAIFRDSRAAGRAVGRAYLAGEPGAAQGVSRLARTLALAAASGPQAVRREIAAQRERAWRVGDVVVVDGWVLARTEAELCALALDC